MKRLICLLLAGMLVLCGCGAEQPQNEDPMDDNPVIVPIGERTADGVKVTVHGGLLGIQPDVLTEEQIADGFLEAKLNEDGSVTYLIDNAKYDAFVEKHRQMTCQSIVDTVEGSFGSVTGVQYEDDLSAITLTVRRADYEYSVDGLAVFAVGTIAITHQAYNVDAPGICVITVLDENGAEVSKTVYPEELII